MKTSLNFYFFLFTAFLLTACQTDHDKYFAILSEAACSPITELETPEGLNFEMSEQDFYNKVKKLNPGLDKSYVWLFGNDTIIGEFQGYNFYEGKLCCYEIWIEDSHEDVLPNLINYYKKILRNYKYKKLPELHNPSHIWYKGNLVFRIQEFHPIFNSKEIIIIECENRPISAILEREEQEKTTSSISPRVEVKNSSWDGSVKQVKDYLESSLVDYESIEWSEVKEKSDGYYVRHKYKAKNGFGVYLVTNQLFHLDFSGNIVEVKDLY